MYKQGDIFQIDEPRNTLTILGISGFILNALGLLKSIGNTFVLAFAFFLVIIFLIFTIKVFSDIKNNVFPRFGISVWYGFVLVLVLTSISYFIETMFYQEFMFKSSVVFIIIALFGYLIFYMKNGYLFTQNYSQ